MRRAPKDFKEKRDLLVEARRMTDFASSALRHVAVKEVSPISPLPKTEASALRAVSTMGAESTSAFP
ncbi:MAG: hypothetical protein ACFNYN_08160, partial [Peptidiphaga gingivicola]